MNHKNYEKEHKNVRKGQSRYSIRPVFFGWVLHFLFFFFDELSGHFDGFLFVTYGDCSPSVKWAWPIVGLNFCFVSSLLESIVNGWLTISCDELCFRTEEPKKKSVFSFTERGSRRTNYRHRFICVSFFSLLVQLLLLLLLFLVLGFSISVLVSLALPMCRPDHFRCDPRADRRSVGRQGWPMAIAPFVAHQIGDYRLSFGEKSATLVAAPLFTVFLCLFFFFTGLDKVFIMNDTVLLIATWFDWVYCSCVGVFTNGSFSVLFTGFYWFFFYSDRLDKVLTMNDADLLIVVWFNWVSCSCVGVFGNSFFEILRLDTF